MPDFLETVARGFVSDEMRDGRIPYLLYGVVTDVEAPTASPWLGRIKARVGAQGDREATHWLDPSWQGGLESVPRVGDPVFVQFVDGDPNRGVYSWHPTTRTKNRAQDYILLGTTFCGLFNQLVDQFNQLRTDFNSFVSTYNAHIHNFTYSAGPATGTPGVTVVTTSTGSSTSALAANKGKASDGSVVGNQSSSVVVLSGIAKVQK